MDHAHRVLPERKRVLKTYWWDDVPNFGDRLTPLLLKRLSNVEPEWAPLEEAELVVVGSVLDALPPDWSGTILGAGKIRQYAELNLLNATVLALRGPLTWEDSGAPHCLFGDPGLLAPYLLTLPTDVVFETAIIPPIGETLPFDGTLIDLRDPPLEVIATVARHHSVVSASLHGLVLADALGIPRRWEPSEGADPFKYQDYATAIGASVEPHVWTRAPRDRVLKTQRDLLALFGRL